jgi:hypothetical protein
LCNRNLLQPPERPPPPGRGSSYSEVFPGRGPNLSLSISPRVVKYSPYGTNSIKLPDNSRELSGFHDLEVKLVKRLLVCLSCLFALAMARTLSAPYVHGLQQHAAAPDTLMLFAHQTEDPVRIIQATFSADNALMDALLENKSHQKIQSYRLGWIVIKKDDIRLGKGISVDVPKDLDTTASFSIPGPENAAREDLARHPSGIVFYIAELQFEDGKRWQAEAKKIRKEAADMMK